MKENNTGQTVYEQLQEFLNECIRLGLYIDGCDFTVESIRFDYRQLYVCNKYEGEQKQSIHWLFSKDSGIMERMEWRRSLKENQLDDMLRFAEEKGWDYNNKIDLLSWKYIIMSTMTAEEKCIYFLSNAKLPTKSE